MFFKSDQLQTLSFGKELLYSLLGHTEVFAHSNGLSVSFFFDRALKCMNMCNHPDGHFGNKVVKTALQHCRIKTHHFFYWICTANVFNPLPQIVIF